MLDSVDYRIPSMRHRVSPEEWQARVDLAACYRLVDLYHMSDLIANHVSVRVPGEDAFLINAYGLLYEEITASSLMKVDYDGNILLKPEFPDQDYGVNRAGFVIHSAVHKARHDLACVAHTHTVAGIAVSCLKVGLLPLTQHSMRFYGRIAYHDWEGPATNLDERERLVADLGPHDAMVLRNHGLLAAGRSVAEAFDNIYFLERACQAQIAALAGGAELVFPPEEVRSRTAAQFRRDAEARAARAWKAALRLVEHDRIDYRS